MLSISDYLVSRIVNILLEMSVEPRVRQLLRLCSKAGRYVQAFLAGQAIGVLEQRNPSYGHYIAVKLWSVRPQDLAIVTATSYHMCCMNSGHSKVKWATEQQRLQTGLSNPIINVTWKIKVREFFRLRNVTVVGFYYLFNCYMFRSYDHLQAEFLRQNDSNIA
jgi:hypothetical protein